MAKKKAMCETEGCWQEVKVKSRGLCGACNSWYLFWSKRSAADALERRRRNARIGIRLANMNPTIKLIKDAQKERARKAAAKRRHVERAGQKFKKTRRKAAK